MISNESRFILEYIKSDIGIGTWFKYFNIKEALDDSGVEFSESQFKKWIAGAAQLATLQGLCLAHPTEASDFKAILVNVGADGAEQVTDSYLHLARTNAGVSKRLEGYVDFMDKGAAPGSDADIAASAVKDLYKMQEMMEESIERLNKKLLERRRNERRILREAQAIEMKDEE